MAKKRNREMESVDSQSSSQNTVFIDTNLDTHLALIVSDTDTVSDLKKKIRYEHPQCFPNFGEVKILALKVKRKGNFYHLSDSMRVHSAFEGVVKTWFLAVDAASLKQQDRNQFSTSADVSNQLPLLCFTDNPSGDRNNYLSDSPSQKSSLLGATLLLQHEDKTLPLMGKKDTSTDHSALGDSFKEVPDNVEIKDTHVSVDPCEALPALSNERSNVHVNHDRLNEVNEPLVEDNDRRCSEESLMAQTLSKVEHRSKKKNDDIASKRVMKENDPQAVVSDMAASHPQVIARKSSPGSSHREVLNSMEVDGTNPFETSDTNKRHSGDVQDKLEEHIGDKSRNFVGDEELSNHPLEDASKVDQSTKKKRKRKSTKVLENGTSETPRLHASNPENALKNTTNFSDCTFADPQEDLVANGSSSGRKNKKRQKLSREQFGAAEPSSLHNGGEQGKEKITEVSAKKSDAAAATGAIVSDQDTQHPTLSRPIKDTRNENRREPVPEAVEEHTLPPLTGIGISIPDHTTVAKGKDDASEACDGHRSKGTKKSKKRHNANLKDAPPSVFNELDKEKIDLVPAGKEIIGPGNQTVDESNPEKEEERNHVNNGDHNKTQMENEGKPDSHTEAPPSAKVVETDGLIESGKSSGKRTKRKGKKPTTSKPVESATEHADNFDGVISPIVPRLTSNDHHNDEVQKEESILSQTERTNHEAKHTSSLGVDAEGDDDDMGGNEAKSSLEAHANIIQEVVGNMDENLNKGTKRNRSSDAKASMTSPVEEQAKESVQLNQKENTNRKSKKKPKKGQNAGVESNVVVGDNDKGGDMSGKEGAPLPVVPANEARETIESVDGNSKRRSKKNKSSDARTSTSSLAEEQTDKLETDQLYQIATTEMDAQNKKGKSKRKTKKIQESGAKSVSDVPIQEKKISNDELASSNGRPSEGDKTERKTKSAKRSSKDQLINQEAELHDSGVELVSFESTENASADLTHVPSSNTPELSTVGRRLQFDIEGNALKHCSTITPNSEMEVAKSGGDGVDFKKYFVHGEQKLEVGAVDLGDKLTEVRQSDGEKSKKKGKNPGIPSSATLPDLQNSAKSVLIQESKTKSHSKLSQTLENGVNPVDSHVIKQLKVVPEKAKQPDIVNGSKIVSSVPEYPKVQSSSPDETSSTSERSNKLLRRKVETKLQPSLDQHHARVSKTSSKKAGEVVTNSRHHKSLLATPAAIFKDSSSESSEGHYGPVDSDASTATPSDNSSSSGYSEVESKSGRNGSYNATEVGGADSIRKSQSAGPKHVSMDMIFRSSSRFKKAKITATQSQLEEDTESQPVEFVPESQPIE